jgi:hypothetical protein
MHARLESEMKKKKRKETESRTQITSLKFTERNFFISRATIFFLLFGGSFVTIPNSVMSSEKNETCCAPGEKKVKSAEQTNNQSRDGFHLH